MPLVANTCGSTVHRRDLHAVRASCRMNAVRSPAGVGRSCGTAGRALRRIDKVFSAARRASIAIRSAKGRPAASASARNAIGRNARHLCADNQRMSTHDCRALWLAAANPSSSKLPVGFWVLVPCAAASGGTSRLAIRASATPWRLDERLFCGRRWITPAARGIRRFRRLHHSLPIERKAVLQRLHQLRQWPGPVSMSRKLNAQARCACPPSRSCC